MLFTRLNAKLRGYYNYYGVHGNAASLQECFNSAMRILLKWLNRRSQRHSYTSQGYKEVLERFKVARPRIVGRPKTRQAVLKASADLRKRVFLKSPVRENRTPGSVRGRSGNWPSYRDGLAQMPAFHCATCHNLWLGSLAVDGPITSCYANGRIFILSKIGGT